MRFPVGVRIIALPKSLALRDANFTYAATYAATSARKGHTVLVKRQLRFTHHGPVCTPAEYERMRALLERILRDLKSQVIVSAR